LSQARVRQNLRENPHCRWCTYAAPPNGRPNPAPGNAALRIHKGFAEIKGTLFRPISDRRFFTIGSCFARQLERFLKEQNKPVLSANSIPFEDFPHLFRTIQNSGSGVRTFLNRYNLPSMLSEFRNLAGGLAKDDPHWLLYKNGDKWCDLHYAWNFHDLSLEKCLERRAVIVRHLSRALRDADTYVVTLGLCEAWFDVQAQSYLNSTPPPRVASANPGQFELHFLDYEDNLQALTSIYELLSQLKGKEEFDLIVTVSPVPLNPTFTESDVVVANTEAKAILRAVAGEAARRFSHVTYFPSYEIVMYSEPRTAWQEDQLHVQLPMSRHVGATFLDLLGLRDKTDIEPLTDCNSSG